MAHPYRILCSASPVYRAGRQVETATLVLSGAGRAVNKTIDLSSSNVEEQVRVALSWVGVSDTETVRAILNDLGA